MIADLKPYPVMKDAGLPWLGDIPEHWASERAKWLFTKMDRPVRESDDVVTCFRDGVVTLRKNRRLRGFTEATVYSGYQGIRVGDLVIHGMDAFAGAIGVSDSDGKGTPVYNVCQPQLGVNARYYTHLVRQMSQSQWILALAKGIRERSTDFRFEMFGNQRVPLPPPAEQAAIVRFLDWANGRLERAIRAKRQIITLLNEQKQAIIHRAITRGLDPTAPLKPSGIPWLGDIPAHWEVMPGLVGFVEKQVKNKGMIETKVLSLSYGQIIVKPKEKLHGLVPESFETYQIVEPGDIIIRPTDLQNDHTSLRVGFVRERGIITSAYICLVTRMGLLPEFAFQLFAIYDFMKIFYGLGAGMRQNLSFVDFKRLPILFPPVKEQKEISLAIGQNLAPLTATIARFEREIALLREYRTRLVADVVTGKLDVREAAARLPDEVPRDSVEGDANLQDETETAADGAAG